MDWFGLVGTLVIIALCAWEAWEDRSNQRPPEESGS